MHLSDDILRQLVRGDETDVLTAQSDEMLHLEKCEACQQRLAALSGEVDWFAGLSSEFAKLPTGAEEPWEQWENSGIADKTQSPLPAGDSLITVSIAADPGDDLESSRHDSENRKDAEHGKIRTDFLPPGSHPELLGRLGRYDIEETVGAGGFGIVFKAYDTELRRVVALKVLAPHLMSSGAARKRFAREAQAAAAIVHEHVIPIYDVVSQPEACYLVMQYIAGPSLQERVDAEGPLSVPELLRVGCQIAAGLRAAHQQGLVHRDVKPANILLEQSVDRVLISDFGLARTADDANLTRSGAITGTPHYMSPEQATGAIVDSRSDLFSLGSVLYFACTGHPAFRAPQIVAVLNRICHFPHRHVSEINHDIPGPVADLIDRLLAKDPANRFQTAAEVEQELRDLLADWQSGKIAARMRHVPSIVPITQNSSTQDSCTQNSGTQNFSRPIPSEPATTGVGGDATVGRPETATALPVKQHRLWITWGTAIGLAGCGLLMAWGAWNSWQIPSSGGFPSDRLATSHPTDSSEQGNSNENNHSHNALLPAQRAESEAPTADRNFTFQVVWALDSDSLSREIEWTKRHWQQQDQELEMLLKLLKEEGVPQEE